MFTIKNYLDKKLKQSTFGHFFVKGQTACAYNALKVNTVYFPAAVLPFVKQVCTEKVAHVLRKVPAAQKEKFEKALTDVCNAHVLVPPEYNEISYLEKIKPQIFTQPNPALHVVLPKSQI